MYHITERYGIAGLEQRNWEGCEVKFMCGVWDAGSSVKGFRLI